MLSFYPHQVIDEQNMIVLDDLGSDDYYVHPSGVNKRTDLIDMIEIDYELAKESWKAHKSTFIQFTFKSILNQFCSEFKTVYPL